MSQRPDLERLVPYVPRMLLTRLSGQIEPVDEPFADRFDAALLVADISGFTRLSERLAERGAEGAEQLSEALNSYFARVIDFIQAYGGDVLRFAGDAPIVLFAVGDGVGGAASQRDATMRAVACALAMQAELHDFPVADGIQLSMRVFVSHGPVLAASVGGVENRWELVVSGAPLEDVAALSTAGKAGDVLVTAGVVRSLGDRLVASAVDGGKGAAKVTELRGAPAPGGPAPRVPDLRFEAISPFVSRSVMHCLGAGDSDWLAEMRRVTVSFANLQGLALLSPPWVRDDDEQSLRDLQEAFRTMQTAVYRHGGSINQFLVEDKGVTLLALWGVPSRTHEDDPARAVSAMLEMQRALQKIGVSCASGVTTARVFCGHRGSALRREYAVIGRSVNLAARLMMRAVQTHEAPTPKE